MSRLVDITGAFGLALGLHATGFMILHDRSTSDATPPSEAGEMRIAAAAPALATLVQGWVDGPAIADDIAPMEVSAASDVPVAGSAAEPPARAEMPAQPAAEPADSQQVSRQSAPLQTIVQADLSGMLKAPVTRARPSLAVTDAVPRAPRGAPPAPPRLQTATRDAPPSSDTPPVIAPERISLRPQLRPKQLAVPAKPTKAKQANTRAERSAAPSQPALAPAKRKRPAVNTDKLKSLWGAQVLARIDRRSLRASGRNVQTAARLRILVGRDGRLHRVEMLRSSGDARFDQAAVRAVKRTGRFPRAPAGLNDPTYYFAFGLRPN